MQKTDEPGPPAPLPIDTDTEWLESDGLGGFASGTTAGIRSRRYHALLLTAARPPADRWLLVNGCVAWLETAERRCELIAQHYAPGVTSETQARVERFESEPWPKFHYRTESGITLVQELLLSGDSPLVLVSFKLTSRTPGVELCVRPLLSGRDLHALQHENPVFDFSAEVSGERVTWKPYPGVPAVLTLANGRYSQAPEWYRNFRYTAEQQRGLDMDEDLASPGIFRFQLSAGEAYWLLTSTTQGSPSLAGASAEEAALALRERETRRRSGFPSRLQQAAAAYVVRRGEGRSIIAGYPWFGDWGRDTFIAMRGLCLSLERWREARAILLEWSRWVSDGMLPNRLPDRSDQAVEYNAVDASLWFVIAASELMRACEPREVLSGADRRALIEAMLAIVRGYLRGTRHGIRGDEDGLLSCGEPGIQLTWMDAKVGDHVVTPRIGKPVEVQALWINALHITAEFDSSLRDRCTLARSAFEARFWNTQANGLYDVIDVDHRRGTVDDSCRPNQIFAVGGLPLQLLPQRRAEKVLELVERRLWTPLGLRSLSPADEAYCAHYAGGVRERDTAYHQGTVWPWLAGPFIEGWLRIRGNSLEAKLEARLRFVAPLRAHSRQAGIGHVSEIADGEPPHTPAGCPFQAWSLAELLRVESLIASKPRDPREQ